MGLVGRDRNRLQMEMGVSSYTIIRCRHSSGTGTFSETQPGKLFTDSLNSSELFSLNGSLGSWKNTYLCASISAGKNIFQTEENILKNIFQTETNLIVCLSVFQQPFWPVAFKQPLQLGRLSVALVAETSVSGYQAVSLSLQVFFLTEQ